MRSLRSAIVGAFRHVAPPLVAYYAITIVLPLANGAWQADRRFATHALVVLVVPPILVVIGRAVRAGASAFLRL